MSDEEEEDRARRFSQGAGEAWLADRGRCEALYTAALSCLDSMDRPNPVLLSHVLRNLALVIFEEDRHGEALAHLRRAAEVDPGTDAVATREISRRTAMVALDEGLYDLAAEKLVRARPPEGDEKAEFMWTNYRLLLAERQGRLGEAALHATRMREIWAGTETDLRHEATGLANAVRIDAALRGPEAAAAEIADLVQADQTGLTLNIRTQIDLVRARVALERGQTARAVAILEAAQEAYFAAHGQPALEALVEQAGLLERDGRDSEALDLLLAPIGTVERGDLDPAEFDRPHLGLLLPLLGNRTLRDRFPETWSGCRQRLAELLFSEVPVEFAWRGYVLLSRLLDPPQSRLFAAKRACNLVSRAAATAQAFPEARRRYAQDRLEPFDLALDLAKSAGQVETTSALLDLKVVERVRIGGLVHRAATTRSAPWSADEMALLERIEAARVSAQEARLRAARGEEAQSGDDEAGTALADIAQGLIEGSIWPAPPLRDVFSDLAGPPPPGRAVLRCRDAGDHVEAIVEAGENRLQVTLPMPRARLVTEIVELLDRAEAGADFAAPVARLYAEIAEPLLAHLPAGTAELDILADGPLAALPFGLLARDGSPLGTGMDIAYRRGVAPSDGASRFENAVILGLGAAGATGANADLDGAAAEALSLARHFAATSAPLTRDTLVQTFRSCPDILHVAGHYTMVPDNPADSRLALDDGTDLSARDLFDLLTATGRTAPGLVILSVCEGAAGVVGSTVPTDLPAQFLLGGSEAVVAAAWKVADTDAAAFAESLHAGLAQTQDPRAAFAAATRETGFHGFKLFVRG